MPNQMMLECNVPVTFHGIHLCMINFVELNLSYIPPLVSTDIYALYVYKLYIAQLYFSYIVYQGIACVEQNCTSILHAGPNKSTTVPSLRLNLLDFDKRSPLFCARSAGHQDCVNILLVNNCNDDQPGNSSDTSSTELL